MYEIETPRRGRKPRKRKSERRRKKGHCVYQCPFFFLGFIILLHTFDCPFPCSLSWIPVLTCDLHMDLVFRAYYRILGMHPIRPCLFSSSKPPLQDSPLDLCSVDSADSAVVRARPEKRGRSAEIA